MDAREAPVQLRRGATHFRRGLLKLHVSGFAPSGAIHLGPLALGRSTCPLDPVGRAMSGTTVITTQPQWMNEEPS